MSRAKRMEAVSQISCKMYEGLERWYDEHPDASYEEIEGEGRRVRRQMMGAAIEVLINGRDAGVMVELPHCRQCGREMSFEGYEAWTVHGLEGDTTLERASYLCPECHGQGFFPPGSEVEATS